MTSFTIFLNQKIPVRDGIKLSASLYLPKDISPTSTLFLITPYNVDRNHQQASFFTQNGFSVLLVDSRGRGNSEGKFNPFSQQDGRDGYDVCQWISEQNWNNGRVGMFGGSYLGMVQWLTLKENPPALKSIAPTAAVCPGIDFPKKNNIFYSYLAPYLSFIYGKTSNPNLFSDTNYWESFYYDYYSGKFPYSELLKKSFISFPKFNQWIRHPSFDSFWKSIIPDNSTYEKINIPILTITGYFDDDQYGALYYYKNHLKYNFSFSKENHYIIIGPWDHAGTRDPQKTIDNQSFSETSTLNFNKIHLDWFNWTLNNKEKPAYLNNTFIFFLINENKWYNFHFHNSDLFSNKQFFFLGNNGTLNSDSENNCEYIININSLKTKFNSPDLKLNTSYNYAFHYFDFSSDDNEILFESQPFSEPLFIAGNAELNLFVKTNLPDFDLEFLLYDKDPNNNHYFITRDFLRFRYSKTLEKSEINKTPDKINKISFKNSNIIFKKIPTGHKLVLHIKHLNLSVFQKNYNTGKDVSYETSTDAINGCLTIFCNSKFPSSLAIPLLTEFYINEKF
ncbi:MAG: CocE/NonD family hydrolase [Sphingobacteriales bacterium]|nr:CocE/NonD family hydrolase [Sphingobacteriales bacterium]